MTRPGKHILCRAFFDEPARIQHADTFAHAPDDREIVADEEDRGAEFLAQLRDEIQHLGFDGGVETGSGFVENEQGGVRRERHRDHHALLHAARQLMRITVHHPFRRRDAHTPQHLERARQRLAAAGARCFEGLGNLARNRHRRIQRAARVLVDHRDRGGAHRA